MLTRQEVNELLGKSIRKDTYIIMDWISNGKSYQQCCKYINSHREELGIKQSTILAKEQTVLEYLFLISPFLDQKEQLLIQQKRKNVYLTKSFLKREEEFVKECANKEIIKKNFPNYSHEEKEKYQTKENKNNQSGVYGIYIDNELVYIGETCRSFKERFSQHKYNLETSDLYLYRLLRKAKEEGKKITLQPLIIREELFVKGEIKDRDIKAMELGLINLYKPKCNIEGKLKLYQF